MAIRSVRIKLDTTLATRRNRNSYALLAPRLAVPQSRARQLRHFTLRQVSPSQKILSAHPFRLSPSTPTSVITPKYVFWYPQVYPRFDAGFQRSMANASDVLRLTLTRSLRPLRYAAARPRCRMIDPRRPGNNARPTRSALVTPAVYLECMLLRAASQASTRAGRAIC
jgi:hypothetical protein